MRIFGLVVKIVIGQSRRKTPPNELSHAGPTDVNRAAELEPLFGDGFGDLVADLFTILKNSVSNLRDSPTALARHEIRWRVGEHHHQSMMREPT
jgi:hypothetical protein